MDRAARLGLISKLVLAGCSLSVIGILAAQTVAAPPAEAPKPADAATSISPPAVDAKSPDAKPPDPKAGDAKAPDTKAADTKSQSTYVIGPLDVLQIKVWNNQNLTSLYDVRPDGMFDMQLIGEVKADGLTPEQLRILLTKKIGEFITDPDVSVDVAKINSKKFYIMGEGAMHTGPVPLTEPITLLQALATAGGFQAFANVKRIYVLRGSTKYFFNYNDVKNGKHLEQNIQIQNGDMIFIP